MDLIQIGKLAVFAGIVVTLTGIMLMLFSRYFEIWKLPGDIFISRENFTFYFPAATMIIISVILTLLLNILGRGK